MKRTATAVWNGTGSDGTGRLTTRSKAFDSQPYSFRTRFQSEDGTAGTNPEELIAAAHAGCFTMALAFQLSNAGFTPDALRTEAILTMEKEEIGWTIKAIALNLEATVPGIDRAQFEELAATAKATCPVSRVLNADITLNAVLV
ncbi:MAG: OsmC family protein [Rhodothermaceae bacterium]|nr:OsmC family protein [Rhodothermaceae bacterium]